MIFKIVHRSKNRIHIELQKRHLTAQEADLLYYAVADREEVESIQVFARTAQAIVHLRDGNEDSLLSFLNALKLNDTALMERVPEVSVRATNDHFKEEIVDRDCI